MDNMFGGVSMMQTFPFFSIIFYLISLFVLYLVIQAAVRNGINSSIVGKVMRKKHEQGKRQYIDPDDRDGFDG
jgi:hypothetical protein